MSELETHIQDAVEVPVPAPADPSAPAAEAVDYVPFEATVGEPAPPREDLAGEPVDLLVNGKPIARGEVVVIDEEFGLRVTEVTTGVSRSVPR